MSQEIFLTNSAITELSALLTVLCAEMSCVTVCVCIKKPVVLRCVYTYAALRSASNGITVMFFTSAQ